MPHPAASLAGRRCVVLGGAGFIGTNLCAALAKASANVIGVDFKPPNAELPAMQWHCLPFEESAQLGVLLKRTINGAGETSGRTDYDFGVMKCASNSCSTIGAEAGLGRESGGRRDSKPSAGTGEQDQNAGTDAKIFA